MIGLNAATVGAEYRIIRIDMEKSQRLHLYELGIREGATVIPKMAGPLRDPVAYEVKDTVIALRKRDTEKIEVEPV